MLSHKILKKPAKIRGFAAFSVLEKWQEIFPAYAKYMRPLSLRKGVLRVATNSGSAATNLRMQGPYLLARINQYFGYNAVKSIQYSIRNFSVEEEPLTMYLEDNENSITFAEEACASIENNILQKSFERLASVIYLEKN